MTRRWLQRLILIALGVGMALTVAVWAALNTFGSDEIVSRLLFPYDCQPAPGDWENLVRQAVSHYRTPCADFFWQEYPDSEYRHRVQLNNYGLHDTPIAMEKPPDTFRILLIGDSFAQGWQVPLQQGFPWRVEGQLNADPAHPVEVINLSVDAFGTDRELLLYTVFGWRFQPDLVLLSIYAGNDIQENQIDLERRRYGSADRAFFTLRDDALQLHLKTIFTSRQNRDVPAYQWLAGLTLRQSPAPPEHPPDFPRVLSDNPYKLTYPVELGLYLPEDSHWMDAWALTETLLLHFRNLAEAQGSAFATVIIPDRRAVHAEDWESTTDLFNFVRAADPTAPADRLERFLSEHGIPVLNLTGALRDWAEAHPDERLYYPLDGHLNADGHSVVAGAIRAWLQGSRLVR